MAKWIPVTEWLPPMGQNVLLLSTKGRCTEGYLSGSWWQYRWGAQNNSQEVTHLQEVTHWMPLPEPPEEDANNG